MKKSEVYSWRVSPELKSALEESARGEQSSVAELLERIVRDWLLRTRKDDEEVQERLHEAAAKCFGKLQGGDPHLAEEASARVRETLEGRYGRKGSD
jgi:predicted transcriptional regulator